MKLMFNALALYCMTVYNEICVKLFNIRVNRLIEKNSALTDSLTLKMSEICWHMRVKLKLAESEFYIKCARCARKTDCSDKKIA